MMLVSAFLFIAVLAIATVIAVVRIILGWFRCCRPWSCPATIDWLAWLAFQAA